VFPSFLTAASAAAQGCDFWEEEERLKLLNAQAPAADNRFLQAETDWSVEAVVDEDQL
jgi:hypothetical protein